MPILESVTLSATRTWPSGNSISWPREMTVVFRGKAATWWPPGGRSRPPLRQLRGQPQPRQRLLRYTLRHQPQHRLRRRSQSLRRRSQSLRRLLLTWQPSGPTPCMSRPSPRPCSSSSKRLPGCWTGPANKGAKRPFGASGPRISHSDGRFALAETMFASPWRNCFEGFVFTFPSIGRAIQGPLAGFTHGHCALIKMPPNPCLERLSQKSRKGRKGQRGQKGQIALGGFLRLPKAPSESFFAYSTLSTFWIS